MDGVEITVFEYTLRHVTTKFAHMNGHWKAYNEHIFDIIFEYWYYKIKHSDHY